MFYLLSVGIGILSSAVVIIPAMFILQYTLFKKCKLKKTVMIILFAIYQMEVFSVTGIPAVNNLIFEPNFNFVPFEDIITSPGGFILNIIMFIPFGFFMPVIWDRYRSLKSMVFMGFIMSLFIEILQIFTYRATDIDDIITNTAGAFIGYCIAKLFLRKFNVRLSDNPIKGEFDIVSKSIFAKNEAIIVLAIIFLIKFLIQPFISDVLWNLALMYIKI